MKSLFLITLMASYLMVGAPEEELMNNQGLDIQLNEIVFTEMVKVYDYEGNLLREFQLADVVNNDINVDDYFLLEQSDFAFNHLGDYYYFSDKDFPATVN